MKFSVLAVDFDGTIAKNDRLDPEVLATIEIARRRGIAAVLVTRRTLKHLQKDAGDLNVFDAIVAENGAVLKFPGRRSRYLTRAPSGELMEKLQPGRT